MASNCHDNHFNIFRKLPNYSMIYINSYKIFEYLISQWSSLDRFDSCDQCIHQTLWTSLEFYCWIQCNLQNRFRQYGTELFTKLLQLNWLFLLLFYFWLRIAIYQCQDNLSCTSDWHCLGSSLELPPYNNTQSPKDEKFQQQLLMLCGSFGCCFCHLLHWITISIYSSKQRVHYKM